ncbi:MAG: PmoA family protein [Planctomycetia bacterium]|nr:PmoA family protein [Planctomycetia bacterium]
MKAIRLAAAVVVILLAVQSLAEDAKVQLDAKDGAVELSIGGQPLATYRHSKDLPKPFFIDVRGEGGAIVTRGLENPEDHPHHKGVWVAIDEVNGVKFWAEKGKIENKKTEIVAAAGNPARMRVTNHWLGSDGEPVVVETTDIAIYANRLFSYDIRFAAASKPVVFEDTKEGLFGLRVANSLREKQGGKVVNADGLKGTKDCWGKASPWVDYVGQVDEQTHGVALFDHPDNPRKSRYHVRDYGLFTLSPFGEKSYSNGKEAARPLHLQPGETFRLRYGLYVHRGDTEAGKVAEVYKRWAETSK